MAHITIIIPIPPTVPIPKAPIRQIPFQQGTLRAILIPQHPAPRPAQEVQSTVWLPRCNMSPEFEGGDEGGDVVEELRSYGTDGGPVLGQEAGDGGGALGGGGVEEEDEGVCVLGVESSIGVIIAECPVGDVKGLGVYSGFQRGGLGVAGGGERGLGHPGCELGAGG